MARSVVLVGCWPHRMDADLAAAYSAGETRFSRRSDSCLWYGARNGLDSARPLGAIACERWPTELIHE
jgi:hypothetical protein